MTSKTGITHRKAVRYSYCNRGETNSQKKRIGGKAKDRHGQGGTLEPLKRKRHPSQKIQLKDINRRRSTSGYQVVAPSKQWPFLLREFTQYTTLHGIRYTTLDTRFVFRRIFWWFIVGATLGIFIFYVWDRVGEYLKYKKNVSVEENYVNEMTFPAVTFCNQNRIRLTAAAEKGWYHRIKEMFPEDIKHLRSCNSEEFSCLYQKQCVPLRRRCDGFPDCQDESDETQCNPCPRLVLTGGNWNGTMFFEQKNTFDTPGQRVSPNRERNKKVLLFIRDKTVIVLKLTAPTWSPVPGLVYMGKTMTSQYLFVYYNGYQWQLINKLYTNLPQLVSELYTDSPHAWAQNSSLIFPMDGWTSSDTNQSTFTFRCHHNTSLRESPGWASRTSMKELYTGGTHRAGVFIEKCTWKGRDCILEEHFKETFTDMGKCYTFKADDMFVKSSGPGNGLTLSLNIEQYEYTKNPATGVGIKVLLHEHDDEPLMSEKSIAISPGLYSLLAIEKTVIQTLQHPWGNCTELDLNYYKSYTVSTCKMECDNINARSQCGCRNAHMPEHPQGNDKHVCSVDDYINCWLPYIREKQKSKDYCKCNLPCLEAVYVPSLSFAAISTDEDAIKSRRQEKKMANLQEKLTKAREIAYRLAEDKYRETMRMLQIIEFRATNLILFLEVAHTLVDDEKVVVFDMYDGVQKQCKGVVQTLTHLESLIRSTLQPTLNHLQSVLIMLNFQVADFTDMLANGTDTLTDDDSYFLDTLGHFDFNFHVEGYEINIPLLNDSIVFNTPEFIVRSNITFQKFKHLVYFALLRTRATTILNSVKIAQNDLIKHVDRTILNFPNISGIEIVTQGQKFTISSIKIVLKILIGRIDEELERVRRQVHSGMKRQTYALGGGTKHEVNMEFLGLNDLISNINHTIYNNIVVVLDELTVASSRLSPKCEYESNNLLQSYSETQKQIKANLAENMEECGTFLAVLSQTMKDYIHSNTTLSRIADHFQMMHYTSDLQYNKLAMGNLLQQNVVFLHRLMDQSELIRIDISRYQGDFLKLHQPSYMFNFSNQAARDYKNTTWIAMITKIKVIQHFMDLHIRNLSMALKDADKYLQTYADGNILNENFFKKNYLQLDLFYKTLTDKKLIQQKAYEYPALLSEVGGLMGLLLGGSVITIFECIDLIFYNGLVKLFERKMNHTDRVQDIRRSSKRLYPHQVQRRGPLNVPIATFDPMDGLEYSPNSSPRHKFKHTF